MKKIAVALVATALATSAWAALSPQYADFPKGPAQFLLTKDELNAWKNVKTDEQAKNFIDLFWARRDPTPTTPANEFREGFDQRVKLADDNFGANKKAGSLTDRGKVFVLLGAPTRMRRSGSATGSTIQTAGGLNTNPNPSQSAQPDSPKWVWIYEQAKTRLQLGTPELEINYIDQYSTGDWTLERGRNDHQTVFAKVAQATIAQPDLKQVPTFAPAAAAPVAATQVAVAPAPATITTAALRAAVDAVRAGTTAAAKDVYVSHGEFITADGEHFVPVQLYVPKGAALPADANVTFFGAVEKAEGGEVVAFEEAATLAATKDDRFVAKSLRLEPGKYKGTFGLAVEGKPLSVVTSELTVAGLTKEGVGISNLLLSNNVYPLSEAQLPTDPFAFGGIQVVPKSDRTFRRSDELWYFFELRNPAIDPATSAPKLLVSLTVAGKSAEGKNVKMAAPAEETSARELKGVAGHWAVGQAMPLETFKPGDYTLSVKVKDMTSGQTYDLKESFKIVE